MAKTKEKIISPSDAARSLQLFSEKVLHFKQMTDLALKNGLVDIRISKDLQEAVDAVNEFYKIED